MSNYILEYTIVQNPVWADKEHTIINCEVNFNSLPEEFVSFTASSTDSEPHGVEIYNKCIAGDFGVIADYTPIVKTAEELAASGRSQRNRLLSELDIALSNPIRYESYTSEQISALTLYRQELLDVPQQVGFPTSFSYPDKPIFI